MGGDYKGQAVFEYFWGGIMEMEAKCFWASSKQYGGMDLKGKIGICWWCVAWEGVRGDVDGGAGGLPDLLDLHPLLPNDGATLAARHQQVQVQIQFLITIP